MMMMQRGALTMLLATAATGALALLATPAVSQNRPADKPVDGKSGLGKLPNAPTSGAQPKPVAPTGAAPVNPPRPAPSPTPTPSATPGAATTPSTVPSGTPTPAATPRPTVAAAFGTGELMVNPTPVVKWTVEDAIELLSVINDIGNEGLFPADYQPDALRAAINAGVGDALDQQASRSFDWLAEDLRDGRTPMPSRVQWFAVDPDQDDNPTEALLQRATTNHAVTEVLASLTPTYFDYQTLRDALIATPKADAKRRDAIRINMDRWRWLPRDLGNIYLITNVPEFQLRLTVNGKPIRTYRTIVGRPGKTATPQLAEKVQNVVFNPTWTVPQSIVVGEGLGAQLLARPRAGYKVTKSADGTINVVQQPGDSNSLGRMKIDMPNPHAIYLHDTPSKGLFNASVRAFSHGCIRTERAVELGMTMAILGAGMSQQEAVASFESLKYRKVPMTRTFPVYLVYMTLGSDINGQLAAFADIYGRDKPVIDSFRAPRQLHTSQRASTEAIIKLDNPL